ncbi:MAG TPA: hypothetical protein VHA15_16300 [Burkholderiales bacterium]|jgi:hypothetical protein|nr:hypothetical protein [Burkholderiales bacterium]
MPIRPFALLALLIAAAAPPTLADEPGIGRFEYSVRAASEPAVPADPSAEWGVFAGLGAVSGMLGAMAPPFFASGLIVGGVVLVPGVMVMAERQRRILTALSASLQRAGFPAAVDAALQRRAAAALPQSEGRTAKVALTIQTFGVIGQSADWGCMIVATELAVHLDGKELERASLSIGPARSTRDAPPPQCAFLDRFAEEDGRLVSVVAAEYAEVIAALAVARLASLRREGKP